MLQKVQKLRTVQTCIKILITWTACRARLDTITRLFCHECPKLFICCLNLLQAELQATAWWFFHTGIHEFFCQTIMQLETHNIGLIERQTSSDETVAHLHLISSATWFNLVALG